MADTYFEGFSSSPLVAQALEQPIGSQKLSYGQQLLSILTTTPTYKIEVSGQVKYQATISVALSATSVGVVLPAQFTEPPTINLADPLTANALEVLENPLNPTIRVVTPIKVGGGAAFATADKALTGLAGDTLRTSGRRLLAPAVLDVTGGGGGGDPPAGSPLITVDRLVDDMKLASVSQPRFGTSLNAQAGGYAVTYDNVKAVVDAGPTTSWKFYDYMNEILPWFWVYAGVGHNDALNLRLQYGWGVISVLRKSTNQWVDSSLRVGGFSGYVWSGNDATPSPYNRPIDLIEFGDYRDHSDGSRSSRFTENWGCELWFERVLDRNLIVDSKAVAIICQCRVIDNNNQPYFGSNASYAVHLGFDYWGRDAPGNDFYQSSGLYWGNAANGFNNRWINVTNGNWTSVAMITMQPYNTTPGNAHTGDYGASFPWCLPPWTLTEAQVRANPPTWAT